MFFLAMVAALGGFLFGFDTAVISGALSPLIGYFSLESLPLLQGWLVSSVVLGCVIGAAVSGYFADKLGRKYMLVWAGFFFLVSSVGSAMAETFYVFIAFRLLAGLAVGIAAMVAPLYIAEIAPAPIRGRLVALNQFALTIGVLLAYLSNDYIRSLAENVSADGGLPFLGEESWRAMIGMAGIPSAIFLILIVAVPESPRFLVLKHKTDEALRILTRINGKGAESEMNSIRNIPRGSETSVRDLFRPTLRRATFIAFFLAVVSQLCGIDIVLHYGPLILERAGLSFGDSLGGQLIFGVVLVVFSLLAMWKVDTLGRRPLLFAGNVGICISLLLIGYFFGGATQSTTGLLIAISCFVASFAFSLGPIPWIVMSEIFPARIRGQAMALATVVLFGVNWIIAQLFPLSIHSIGEQATFWILALLTLPTFLFIWKVLPETRGKLLEDTIIGPERLPEQTI